jgi:hypothetical protein
MGLSENFEYQLIQTCVHSGLTLQLPGLRPAKPSFHLQNLTEPDSLTFDYHCKLAAIRSNCITDSTAKSAGYDYEWNLKRRLNFQQTNMVGLASSAC